MRSISEPTLSEQVCEVSLVASSNTRHRWNLLRYCPRCDLPMDLTAIGAALVVAFMAVAAGIYVMTIKDRAFL